MPGDNHLGTFEREQEIFCRSEVFFLGDMLALVVAESEEQARNAAKAVTVSYREAEGIYSIEDGLAKGAVLAKASRDRGDLAAAKREDLVVVRGDYRLERVEHGCLETEAAAAVAGKALGCPVKIVLNREESLCLSICRRTVSDSPSACKGAGGADQ